MNKVLSDHCPTCGALVPAHSPLGLCPRCCLLGLGGGSDFGLAVPGVELGEPLGSGNFGDVYEGIQVHAGFRRVAVKLLKTDSLGSAHRARFLEETQLLALLEHPHIARLHSSGRTDDDRPYYIMELVEGRRLDHWAQENSIPDRLRVFRQITDAVAYAHRRGIVHRDLKPANILVQNTAEGPIAKVIDFGIARALTGPESWGREATHIDQRIGTPLYMSPEQLGGDPRIDTRTDIWALGLILYELLLGHPILGKTITSENGWSANLNALRHFAFPPLPRKELDWIALKATALDPADRYPSADALLADLTALDQGRAVSVGSAYWKYRTWKWASSHKTLLTIVSVFLIALIAITLTSWRASVRERIARQRIEAAELQTRQQASDTELLAATRAMDAGNYEESRRKLESSLTLWPENAPARYALNFIRTTVPFANSPATFQLPWQPQAIAVDESGFLLRSPNSEILHLAPDGILTSRNNFPTENPTRWTDPENGILITLHADGRFTFVDPATSSPALAPVVFGSGRELATYHPSRHLMLVCNNDQTATLWDTSPMGRAYESITLGNEPTWFAFERDTSHLWIMDKESRLRKWSANSPKPGFSLTARGFSNKPTLWQIGEGHTRGLPSGKTGIITVSQIAVWNILGKGAQVTSIAQARESDRSLVGGGDKNVPIGFQAPENLFRKIHGALGIPKLLAIDAHGTIGAQINHENLLQIIDPASLSVTATIPLERPASSLAILDGAQDLIIAHQDGTISILDLPALTFRHRHLPLLGTPAENVQVRALPRTREFLSRLDGDTLIRRHSALTAAESGPPLRHQNGVHWFCASNDGEFLFSIDQNHTSPGTLRIWSLRTAREIVPGLRHPAPIIWATVLNDGKRIATSDTTNTIRRWALAED